MSEGVVHVIDDDPAMRDSLAFLMDSAGLAARTYDSALTFLDRLPQDAVAEIVSPWQRRRRCSPMCPLRSTSRGRDPYCRCGRR